jgi:hypothetical protein
MQIAEVEAKLGKDRQTACMHACKVQVALLIRRQATLANLCVMLMHACILLDASWCFALPTIFRELFCAAHAWFAINQ